MEHSSPNKEDHAMAQLILNLSRQGSSLVGDPPNDEELTAYYEGGLDVARRAQITAYIANDDTTYQRWLRLVEVQDFLKSITQKQNSSASASARADKETSVSLTQKINAWLFGDNMKWVGASFATLAVGVIALSFFFTSKDDSYSSYIDNLYQAQSVGLMQEWGQYSASGKVPPVFAPSRSFFNIKSDARKVIETGYVTGAKSLNSEVFAGMGIKLDQLSQNYTHEQSPFSQETYNALFDLGRVSAFMLLQCTVSAQSAQVAAAYEYEKRIFADLSTIDDTDVKEIAKSFLVVDSPASATCAVAESVSRVVAK